MALSPKAIKNLKKSFLGELIICHLQSISVAIVDPEQGEMNVAAMIEGYLLDADSNFLYLGTEDGYVQKIIPTDALGPIELAVTQSILDTININQEEAH